LDILIYLTVRVKHKILICISNSNWKFKT